MILLIIIQIPLLVNEIDNDNHPVEVGLSDALYVDTVVDQR